MRKHITPINVVIVLVVLCFAGCIGFGVYNSIDALHLHEGKIVRKIYTPAHLDSYTDTYTDKDGNKTYVPRQSYTAASYVIIIEGMRDDGKRGTRAISLCEGEYAPLKIGDFYRAD